MAIIHYQQCPVCGDSHIRKVLTVKDYTVSQQLFDILECNTCTLRFTQDVPAENAIGPYYKSENYISHSNTSKGIINRLYQAVRQVTLVSKRKLVQRVTKKRKGSLLDVGSGTGAFVHAMQQSGWQATGIEPDEDARAVAANNWHIQLQDISELQHLPTASFDAITLWHVLEHVHSLHPYMEQLKKLLKPAGKLFIAVPNYTAADARKYGAYWAAYDVPRHLYHFSPLSMQILTEQHGLQIKQYLPMWFDSYYISMLSSQYKHGKANLPAAFINGSLSNFSAFGNSKKCSSVIYVLGAN